jgi:hypothetical protein
MKIRQSFVSNSSSASFTVALNRLTAKQYQLILDYPEAVHNDPLADEWEFSLIENDQFLRGSTYIDNGDLSIYLLKQLGLQVDKNTSDGILDSLMLTNYGFTVNNENNA